MFINLMMEPQLLDLLEFDTPSNLLIVVSSTSFAGLMITAISFILILCICCFKKTPRKLS